MQFDWWTLALQTVNFAVLVWLLHRFLYKPVLRTVDARRAEIEAQYADAHAADSKAKAELAAIEAERTGIAAERLAALKAAAVEAEDQIKARQAQAEHEAAALLEDTRKTLATEREKALAEARRVALDFGAEVARRLLAEVPMQLRAEAWLERIEQHLAALPIAELKALGQQFVDGATLTVVTASALPPEMVDAWRTRLRRCLGDGVVMAFDVNPDLVAGAELHFPSAILRFSWQSALATVRSELDAHDDAH